MCAECPIQIPLQIEQVIQSPGSDATLLTDCAIFLEELYPAPASQSDTETIDFCGVYLGPKQRALVDAISERFRITLASGYRSPFTKPSYAHSISSMEVFLIGNFATARSRPYSAIMYSLIAQSEFLWSSRSLPIAASLIQLPTSVTLPYLCDPIVAFEPWHWRMIASDKSRNPAGDGEQEGSSAGSTLQEKRSALLAATAAALDPTTLGRKRNSHKLPGILRVCLCGAPVLCWDRGMCRVTP